MKNMVILLIIIIFCLNNNCYGLPENYNSLIKDNSNDTNYFFLGINNSFFDFGTFKNFQEDNQIDYLKRKRSGYFWLYLILFIVSILTSILYLYWDIIIR